MGLQLFSIVDGDGDGIMDLITGTLDMVIITGDTVIILGIMAAIIGTIIHGTIGMVVA